MGLIYVLDKTFTIQGVIDEYVSAIWRPAYTAVGDFEIYMSASPESISLLRKDWFVVRAADVSVIDGVSTFRKVMQIKNLQLTTSVEDGDFYTVTGRELKYILHQRIVWKQTTLTGNAENAVRRLVNENAINPIDSNRIIPQLVLGAAGGLTDSIHKQVTGAHLDEAIIEICTACNYGWDIYISGGQMVLEVYRGQDRSYGQSALPYVVFSDDFENLYNTDYQLASEQFANTTLIGGEGEGSERIYSTVGAQNIGFDRFETFTDARDISKSIDNENELSDEDYLLLLQERGKERLATLAVVEGFSGEAFSDVSFKYEEDFFLGDVVTVINKYGFAQNVRVLSAIESDDDTGSKLLPQFASVGPAFGLLTINGNGILDFAGNITIDHEGILHAMQEPKLTDENILTWNE